MTRPHALPYELSDYIYTQECQTKLILYLMYEKTNYVELCAHWSVMLIPKYENSPLLALPFNLLLIMLLLFVIVWLQAVQFLRHYRCTTFTITQALLCLCPLHCGPWKCNLPGWPIRPFEQIFSLFTSWFI